MYYESNNAKEIADAIRKEGCGQAEYVMIFVAEKSAGLVDDLIKELNQYDLPFFGAIFPRLILGNENMTHGVLFRNVKSEFAPILVQNIREREYDLSTNKELEALPADGSLMILVDGLTSHVGRFLNAVYNRFGNKKQFMGAGAGYLTLEQGPCLFTKDGFFQDAALLCQFSNNCTLGVKHGWDPVFGPLVANKTEANVIKQLNWRPAIDVYKEVVEKESKLSFDDLPFGEISKGFPFGIDRVEGESVVRDPIAVDEDGGLVCLGEVPENSVLTILHGNNETLIKAAGNAAEETQPNPEQDADGLIFDCITRVMFLEDDYSSELDLVIDTINKDRSGRPATVYGALTMGEISSPGQGFLELYNKTIVVALMDE